jgi:hypothetical protein
MSPGISKRSKVFISYSHQDLEWLKRLRVHLRPLEREYEIEVWDDTKIKPGSMWKKEIEQAIQSAKVAVLLISADFLASDFIAGDELPPLLKVAQERGAIILPVIVSYSRFLRTRGLAEFQSVNDPSRPLDSLPKSEQEKVFVTVSEHIETALNTPVELPVESSVVTNLKSNEEIAEPLAGIDKIGPDNSQPEDSKNERPDQRHEIFEPEAQEINHMRGVHKTSSVQVASSFVPQQNSDADEENVINNTAQESDPQPVIANTTQLLNSVEEQNPATRTPFALLKSKLRHNPLYYVLSIAGALLLITSIVLLLLKRPISTASDIAATNQNTGSISVKNEPPVVVNLEDLQLIPFRKGNKWGFSDVNKHLFIEAKYDGADRFSEGLAKVWFEIKTTNENSYNYKPKPSQNRRVKSSKKPVKKFKYGFIDKSGKEVINVVYDMAGPFKEGWTTVMLDGSTKYLDKNGNEIPKPSSPPGPPSPTPDNLRFSISSNGKYGFLDKTDKFVIKPQYEGAWSFSGRVAPVKLGSKWGFIDTTNKFIIKPTYDNASLFSEGMSVVELSGKYGFIDTSGSVAIPLNYDYVSKFIGGVAKVRSSGKYGLIDKKNSRITKINYEDIERFSEDLAVIKTDSKYGFIDKEEKLVIEPKYDKAESFSKDLALVELNGISFYIGRDGTEYYEP